MSAFFTLRISDICPGRIYSFHTAKVLNFKQYLMTADVKIIFRIFRLPRRAIKMNQTVVRKVSLLIITVTTVGAVDTSSKKRGFKQLILPYNSALGETRMYSSSIVLIAMNSFIAYTPRGHQVLEVTEFVGAPAFALLVAAILGFYLLGSVTNALAQPLVK